MTFITEIVANIQDLYSKAHSLHVDLLLENNVILSNWNSWHNIQSVMFIIIGYQSLSSPPRYKFSQWNSFTRNTDV